LGDSHPRPEISHDKYTYDSYGNIKKKSDVGHPGMMGDGTEEQNLDERGNPAARIEEDELDAAFGNQKPKK
jgi:hypothetical protein